MSVVARCGSPLTSRFRVAAAIALLTACPARTYAAEIDPNATIEDCDALVRSHPDQKDSYRCFYEVARRSTQWDEAARRLAAYRPTSDYALAMLAVVESARGRREEAMELYRQAITVFGAKGDRLEEGLARLSLARQLRRGGSVEAAAAELRGAEAAAEASGDRILRSWVRLERSSQLEAEGRDYGTAYRLLRQVEDDAFPDGPYQIRINCLGALGRITQSMGRKHESLAYLGRVEEAARQAGDRGNVAIALVNRVYMEIELLADGGEGSASALMPLARAALDASLAAGDPAAEAGARWALGQLLTTPEARLQYLKSLAIARQTGDVEGIGAALRGLAEYVAAEEPENLLEARRDLDEALDLARRNQDFEEIVRTSLSRSMVGIRRGPREAAIADGLATLDGIEALRDLQPEETPRAEVLAPWLSAYHGLAGYLLEAGGGSPAPEDLDLAFLVMERMRARVLLEALEAAQRNGTGGAPAPAEGEDPRLADVRGRIVKAQRGLVDPSLAGAGRQAALRQLERLEIEEADLLRETAGGGNTDAGNAGAAAPGQGPAGRPTFPSLREVRAALDENEALLSFQIAPPAALRDRTGGSWLVVLTRDAARAYALPERADLASAVDLFAGLLERRDGREGPAAARLYRDLLAAAVRDLPTGVSRLVIVPDGVLHRLPFGVLGPAPEEDPLAVRYVLTVAPSATLWLRWRREARRPAGAPAIVLADPEIGPWIPAPKDGADAVPLRAWAFTLGSRLGALPRARAEGRFLVRRLGGGSRLLVGSEATEHFVKTGGLGRYAVVHFAAHAVLDDERPERSSVVLAPGGPDEDGLLQLREVSALNLDGHVVVLSVCQGASGAILGGEGVMGLARAFFQGGARAVVGSIWSLRDTDAQALFEEFYRRLGEGESVAGALAAAQRAMRLRGAPPAAWAGLVVLGDGSTVPIPGGRARPAALPTWVLWLAVAAVGAALLAAVAFPRRHAPRS